MFGRVLRTIFTKMYLSHVICVVWFVRVANITNTWLPSVIGWVWRALGNSGS